MSQNFLSYTHRNTSFHDWQKTSKKIVKVCLHSSYTVQISLQFDEFFLPKCFKILISLLLYSRVPRLLLISLWSTFSGLYSPSKSKYWRLRYLDQLFFPSIQSQNDIFEAFTVWPSMDDSRRRRQHCRN